MRPLGQPQSGGVSIRSGHRFAPIVLLFSLAFFPALRAMVFYSTADPDYNTSAPTGALLGCGWEWVGTWGGFQGTPIGPHHFIAANHVGGTVGDPFVFQGVSYTTIASTVDPASDLRIWQISGTFQTWAPLYRNGDEVGRSLVVMGRGVTRGADVLTTVSAGVVPAGSLAGWYWGSYDGRLRWGQNVVSGTFTHPTFGPQLAANFDEVGGANECHLGTGDSSGPVFIDDGSGWKLAGVAGLVDSGFSTTSGGATFNACIFDERGLYVSGALQTGSSPRPSAFYATRISARLAWIDSVAPPPDDSSDAPLLSPTEMLVLVVLLFAGGVIALRGTNWSGNFLQ